MRTRKSQSCRVAKSDNHCSCKRRPDTPNITTDVCFLQGGKIPVGQQNFGKFEFISPMPNTEFRLDLTYWLTDSPAGIYDVQTVVHDQNSSTY